MGTDVHVQRTPAEVSVENNYKGISDLVDEVSENSQTIEQTQSSLTTLEDEVHSGWADKTAGAVAAVGAGGLTAGTRAATEEDLGDAIAGNDMLLEAVPMLAQNGDITAAAGLTAVLAGGVYATQQAIDGSGILEKIGGGFKSLKDRLSIFDDDEKGQREEEGREKDNSGILSW